MQLNPGIVPVSLHLHEVITTIRRSHNVHIARSDEYFVTICLRIKKYHFRNQNIILKDYPKQEVGNFESGKQVNNRSYTCRQVTWSTNEVNARDSEAHLHHFSHEYRYYSVVVFYHKNHPDAFARL